MEKPLVSVRGSDTYFELGHQVQRAMRGVYDDAQIEEAMRKLYAPHPISQCIAGIEEYVRVEIKFGE